MHQFDNLSDDQALRLECARITGDAADAMSLYKFILGEVWDLNPKVVAKNGDTYRLVITPFNSRDGFAHVSAFKVDGVETAEGGSNA